jgi:hypothetical protein
MIASVMLGATSRVIFPLPATLVALAVAAVLIVRPDIDIGFTTLGATLLNGGFLLGVAMARALPRLLVSPPGTVDEADAGFIVRDHNGQVLACVGFERPAADSLLTRDEARWIALSSIAKMPKLLRPAATSDGRCKKFGWFSF